MALLCEIIAEQAARRRCEDRLAFVIRAYVRQLARRFLARATALPGEPRPNAPGDRPGQGGLTRKILAS